MTFARRGRGSFSSLVGRPGPSFTRWQVSSFPLWLTFHAISSLWHFFPSLSFDRKAVPPPLQHIYFSSSPCHTVTQPCSAHSAHTEMEPSVPWQASAMVRPGMDRYEVRLAGFQPSPAPKSCVTVGRLKCSSCQTWPRIISSSKVMMQVKG